jgi:hypothetical protein
MQRWEYLTVEIRYNGWSDSLGRRGSLPVDSFQTGPLLNDLGEQGWELAGVADRNGHGVLRLFLKRPRS